MNALDFALEALYSVRMDTRFPKSKLQRASDQLEYHLTRAKESSALANQETRRTKDALYNAHIRASKDHDTAAEAHEKAASALTHYANEKARVGQPVAESLNAADMHSNKAAFHREASAMHMKAAGSGVWDEDKHPRDENGKFT